MDIANIGNFLRKARKSNGLTQSYIADCLGVSAQAVSKWERGENLPDVTFFPDIAKILGVGIDEILDAGKIRPTEVRNKQDGYAQMSNLQKLFDTDFFQKILKEIKDTKTVEELNISLDFTVYLNAQQKMSLFQILLEMPDYHLALDEIFPYTNTTHRAVIIRHILEKQDYVLLEQFSTYMSNEIKTIALTKLLSEGRYDIIEDNIIAFTRKQRDLIVDFFAANPPDIEVIENFIPFFDNNQRERLNENLKIKEEE